MILEKVSEKRLRPLTVTLITRSLDVSVLGWADDHCMLLVKIRTLELQAVQSNQQNLESVSFLHQHTCIARRNYIIDRKNICSVLYDLASGVEVEYWKAKYSYSF